MMFSPGWLLRTRKNAIEDESIKIIDSYRPKLAKFVNDLISPSTPFQFELTSYPSEGRLGHLQLSLCKLSGHWYHSYAAFPGL